MKKIKLWNENIPYLNPKDSFEPYLETYLIESEKPVGVIIIVPGGAYSFLSDFESAPIAKYYNSKGYNAVVLKYRLSPSEHPAPLADAQRAIRIVKSNAKKWNIKHDKIAIYGFSAGGHLASTVGVHPNLIKPEEDDLIEQYTAEVNALMLAYPVITAGKFAHKNSLPNLLGSKKTDELLELLSTEKHVSKNTPPTFIWHTVEDQSVPVENSLVFCEALRKHDVPFELHIFPRGKHGLDLALDMPDVAQWKELSLTWLNNMGWK